MLFFTPNKAISLQFVKYRSKGSQPISVQSLQISETHQSSLSPGLIIKGTGLMELGNRGTGLMRKGTGLIRDWTASVSPAADKQINKHPRHQKNHENLNDGEKAKIQMDIIDDKLDNFDGIGFYSLFQLPVETKLRASFISRLLKKNKFIIFCNEKLQQHFNRNTFVLEEDTYKAEGIDFDHIEYIDNQDILNMI